MKVLFSPVGGTDPISLSNMRDGSLLHICRVYQPDVVYLYMSKEILDYHQKDNRYLYCLEKLGETTGFKPDIHIIERPDLIDVYDFNFFYNEFQMIISTIYAGMNDEDEMIYNISSGTPAMKSGLLVLCTLGEYPGKMVQVTTPGKKMNVHIHEGYDVASLWELNEDNDEELFKNRCQEVTCPSLSNIKKEEIIKKHLSVYDYQAAFDVAGTMPSEDTKDYLDLLEMGERRALLDFSNTDKIMRKRGIDCLPVKTSNERKYFEYALTVQIKLKRNEYADFIRAITPLIVDLFELILRKQFRIEINDYCSMRDNNRRWDEYKMTGTEVDRILNADFFNFKYGFVYSVHLKALILHYSQNQRLSELAEDLRHIEENIRNIAAHEIVSITEETIKQQTGFTASQIMEKIKGLFDFTGMNIKREYWNSYDEMNRMIIERIN